VDYSGNNGGEEGEEERRRKKEAGAGLTRLLQVRGVRGREGRKVVVKIAHTLTLIAFHPPSHIVVL